MSNHPSTLTILENALQHSGSLLSSIITVATGLMTNIGCIPVFRVIFEKNISSGSSSHSSSSLMMISCVTKVSPTENVTISPDTAS